jgi:hypothetical protein
MLKRLLKIIQQTPLIFFFFKFTIAYVKYTYRSNDEFEKEIDGRWTRDGRIAALYTT